MILCADHIIRYRTNSDAKAHADGDDWDVATGHVEAGRAIKAEKAKPARGQAKRGGAPSARGPSKDKVEIDWSAPTAVSTLNISLMDIANMEEALEDLGVDAVDKWGMTVCGWAILISQWTTRFGLAPQQLLHIA